MWINTWSALLYGKTRQAAKRTFRYDASVQGSVEDKRIDKLVKNEPDGL